MHLTDVGTPVEGVRAEAIDRRHAIPNRLPTDETSSGMGVVEQVVIDVPRRSWA